MLSFIHPNALWLLLLIPLTVAMALYGRRGPTRARFWGGLALRSLLLALIILALAGTQLRLEANTLTAVFVLDVSDSISRDDQARGEALIRQAVESMPAGDQAAIVLFGQDALVERLASENRTLPGLASVPVTSRTDIASALQLAMALFPDEGAKRLVLLSDGRENIGQALAQADLAAARDIELSFMPLGRAEDAQAVEVLVEMLDAPQSAHQGQGFELSTVVRSTAPANALLQVFGDGQLIHWQPVRLQTGVNRFQVAVEAGEPGFRRFRAQVVPDVDTRLQNNEASAFTVVHGPPQVVIVEGQPGEADNLRGALEVAEMDVDVVAAADAPTTLTELAAYDAVMLANVPAASLPQGTMDALPVYVRDLGRGLLMIGGETGFGAGGYLRSPVEEALPVTMDVRSREQIPNLALVLAVDKSGSMGKCHCENPDLNQTYVRQEVGLPKVDIAKDAVLKAAAALGREDILGVVAFDQAARWAVDAQPLPDFVSLERSIGGIQAEGQTNLVSGVEAAYDALEGADARLKHVILMTDGWVRTGDLTRRAAEMREQGITLSVVAAGGGSAQYLQELAETGGGRYYPAVAIQQVPDFFLKETVKAVGRYIVETPFFPLPSAPTPVLEGLDVTRLPVLYGHNGTTPRGTARVALTTPEGDPLLATWQYGLGRAAAWTSDFKGQWAPEWVAWDGFGRFAPQLASWLMPVPSVEGLTAQASLEEGQAAIRVEVLDEAGRPRNFLEVSAVLIAPDLKRAEVGLNQVSAGRYEANLALSQTGTYLVQLSVAEEGLPLGQQTLGLVVPYSPEYRATGIDLALLGQLAERTGGGPLPEPMAAFLHNLSSASDAREIWTPLLLLVALLLPLDIAMRRVMLGRQDLAQVKAWVGTRLPARPHPAPPGERALGPLFEARERAKQRSTRDVATDGGSQPASTTPTATEFVPPVPAGSSELRQPSADELATDSEDMLARLRRAKRRARDQEGDGG